MLKKSQENWLSVIYSSCLIIVHHEPLARNTNNYFVEVAQHSN